MWSILIWTSPWLLFICFIVMTYLRFFRMAQYVLGGLIVWTIIYPVIGILFSQWKEQEQEKKIRERG